MDYRTLFLTYLAFLTVFTAFAGSLAWRNRGVRGLSWIAAGLGLLLIKVVLQGLENHVSNIFSALIANDIYVIAFLFQYLGLRWFVTREPFRSRWPIIAVFGLIATYTAMFLLRVPHIGNITNGISLVILWFTARTLLRHGKGLFFNVSRWTTVFIIAEFGAYFYRAVLTEMAYSRPWMVNAGQRDPRWIYSLMAMMFLSVCVFMCDLSFLVVELQRELIEQAHTDVLTGALNRRALYEEAEREISRTLRSGHEFSVLLVDIDDFKVMNDTRGHAAGDYVLQRLVQGIRPILRSQDLLARTGGEEFSILLPETGLDHATAVAERVLAAIDRLDLIYEDAPIHISASIGVADLAPNCASVDAILHRADTAMYAAKRSGKNRVIAYRDGLISDPNFSPASIAGLINSPAS